jgi:predicted Zn-dependent protease
MPVAAALLLVALWTWREPLQLWTLRRGPVAGLERYVASNRDSRAGVRALGEAYLREGRPREAVQLLDPMVSRYPADAALRTLLGQALLHAGQPDLAYAHLQLAVNALQAEDPAARWWLGQALERENKADAARQQYEAILQRHPRHFDALMRLGQLAQRDSQLTDAERYYRRAIAVQRQSGPAAVGLAEVLFRLGRLDEAVAEARRAVRLAPQEAQGYLWLGRALQARAAEGDTPAAEAAYREAVRRGGDKVTARYYLAQLLREQGRAAEALAELEANLQENSLHPPSYYELSLCARSLGQKARAEAAMARFRKLSTLENQSAELEYRVWVDPKNVALRLSLARFYFTNGRPDLARPQVERILRDAPDNPEARRLSAQIAAHPEPTL